MRFNDYFILVKNRLLGNKRSSIYSICIIALATVIGLVISNVVYSLAAESFNEMKEMFFFFELYSMQKTNVIYKMVNITMALSVILSSIVAIVYIYKITYSRKTEQRNKLIMGASYFNIIAENLIYNMIISVLGVVLGGLVSFVLGFVVGLILKVSIVFNFSFFTLVLLFYL